MINALESGKIPLDATDDEGSNALNIAVNRGFSIETLKELIKLKVPIDQKNEQDGMTPLLSAITIDSYDAFVLLL